MDVAVTHVNEDGAEYNSCGCVACQAFNVVVRPGPLMSACESGGGGGALPCSVAADFYRPGSSTQT